MHFFLRMLLCTSTVWGQAYAYAEDEISRFSQAVIDDYNSDAAEYKKIFVPKLKQVRREKNLVKKIDLLLGDIQVAKSGFKTNPFGTSLQESDLKAYRRMVRSLNSLRSSLARHDLKKAQIYAAEAAVNDIVDALIWSAKLAISELRNEARGHKLFAKAQAKHRADKSAAKEEFLRTARLARLLFYGTRKSLVSLLPNAFHSAKYKLAVIRIEKINSQFDEKEISDVEYREEQIEK